MAGADRDQWAAALTRLYDLRSRELLTKAHVRGAAEGLGVGERTVWRRMRDFDPQQPPELAVRRGPAPFRLGRADLDAFAFYRGNVAFVHRARDAVLDGRDTVAGGPVPAFLIEGWAGAPPVSLRSLQRAFAEQTTSGYRAALTAGENARRRHEVHRVRPEVPRNTVWEMDHKDLPVLVLPPRGKAARPWLTLITDTGTRAIVGWCLALRPSSATVLTALRMALVHDPDRGPIGAVPVSVRVDGGLDFASTAVRDALAALAVIAHELPPYAPEGKGKIERLNRTVVQTLLTEMVGFTHGPRDAAGRLYGPIKDDARSRNDAQSAKVQPMRIERVAARIGTWVTWYNTERPHSALDGRTPLQAWQDDDSALHRVPAEMLRHLLLAGQERTVQKDGINFNSLEYLAPELDGRVGERVAIRFMPHDDRFIEVYQHGEHLCTAHPQGQLTPEQDQAFRDHKKAEAAALKRELRRAERHAREVLAPLNTDQPDAQEVRLIPARRAGVPEARPRNRIDRLLSGQSSTSLLGLRPVAARPVSPPADLTSYDSPAAPSGVRTEDEAPA